MFEKLVKYMYEFSAFRTIYKYFQNKLKSGSVIW